MCSWQDVCLFGTCTYDYLWKYAIHYLNSLAIYSHCQQCALVEAVTAGSIPLVMAHKVIWFVALLHWNKHFKANYCKILLHTKLTSLKSGDICTDSPSTGISVLGRHSILTTHRHHILCEWSETCDLTLSHVDSTIYGRRLWGSCYLVGELVLQVISPSIAHWRVPAELYSCGGHIGHLQVAGGRGRPWV